MQVVPAYRVESFLKVEGYKKAILISFVKVGLYEFGEVGGFRDNSPRHEAKLRGANYPLPVGPLVAKMLLVGKRSGGGRHVIQRP